MYPLSNLTHQFGEHVIDKKSGLEVFNVKYSHTFIQAAGYLKYIIAKESGKCVLFRGQSKLYDSLTPSIFRGVKNTKPIGQRRELLKKYLGTPEVDLPAVKSYSREALLQHYGIKTTWLDVVDNIWVALWFACHCALSAGEPPEEFLHFEKRIPNNHEEYAYVLLIESAYFNSHLLKYPGYYRDKNSETIDLRVAVSSHFVRPHAQHGLLVRRINSRRKPVGDFLPMHVGTIRVRLSDALDWLGTATTLTSHSLFPPVYHDNGYRELLDRIKPKDRRLGSIYRVQA